MSMMSCIAIKERNRDIVATHERLLKDLGSLDAKKLSMSMSMAICDSRNAAELRGIDGIIEHADWLLHEVEALPPSHSNPEITDAATHLRSLLISITC